MSPTFWRTIDRLGSAPVADLTWRKLLGEDEPTHRPFLRRTRHHASTIADPDAPHRVLNVYPDGDTGFVALGDDRPALALDADDIRETHADVNAIRPALAEALAFVPSATATPAATLVHHIGVVQPTRSQALPVMLYVPGGLPTDRANFLRALATLPACLLYIPTSRWQTVDAFSVATARGISIESLEQRCAATIKTTAPLTVPETHDDDEDRRLRPIIRVQTGWRWEDVRIRLTTRGTLIASHGTERGEHRFVKSGDADAVRRFPTIFRMLIEISFAGHWQNPAPTSRTYDKVSKSFRRLRQTIEALIPIAAESFVRDGNRWRPRFTVQLDDEMEAAARRFHHHKLSTDDHDSDE